jgi:hypothetical protein
MLLYVFGLYEPAFYAVIVLLSLLLFLSFHQYNGAIDEAWLVVRHDGLMIIKALLLIFAAAISST